VGLVALATADAPWTFSHYALRQSIYLGLGIAVLWAVSRLDYRLLCRIAWWIYGLSLLLLLVVLIVGRAIGGSQRWIEFGFVRIQPSEFAKLALVFLLALVSVRLRHQVGWLWTSIVSFVLILPPMALILLQPDLGTALVFVAIWFGLLFLSGADLRILLGFIVIFVLMIPLGLPLLKPYQRERLTAFLDPDKDPLGAGYQIKQSRIAIGHGGWFGQGLFQGSQSRLGYIPGAHTDFIFAIAAEELGVVGATLIILGLFAVILAGLAISAVTDDLLGKLVAGGILGMLAFQVLVNIGISLGLLPVTGMPLPFLSFGGSALLVNCAAIGVLVSIYRHAATKGRMVLIRGL
jgi:rod shape determining protein RodA